MSRAKHSYMCLRFALWVLMFAASSEVFAFEPAPPVEEMRAAVDEPSGFQNPLFVDPRGTQKERVEFMQELARVGKNNRQLIERSLPVIGVNGVMDGIK